MPSKLILVLLFVIIVGSYFPLQTFFYGISAILVLLLVLINGNVQKNSFYLFWLGVPAIVGIIIGLNTFQLYNVIKDVYYFTIPILLFLLGGLMATKINFKNFLQTIIYCGLVVSIIRVIISVSFGGLTAFINPFNARYAINGIVGNPAPIVALAILAYSGKLKFKLFPNLIFRAIFLINLLGVYMFASRTYYILSLCFIFFYFANNFKRVYVLPGFAVSLLFGLLLLNGLGSSNGSASNVFSEKVLKSFTEVSINKFETAEDINNMYRGYESFMALKSFKDGKIINWVCGGFGKLIDLESDVLGDGLRNIPVLHNGWIYILIKTGLLGLLFYVIVLLKMLTKSWLKYFSNETPALIKYNLFLFLGCITGLIITNYVVSSFFNLEMTVLLICLGYCYVFSFKFLTKKLEGSKYYPIKH